MFERHFGIKAYDYWWGYTKAQIELMIADQPFVSYKKDKEKKPTRKDMDDLAARWAESKKSEGGKVKDPLADFKGGERTKLKDFFK